MQVSADVRQGALEIPPVLFQPGLWRTALLKAERQR